MSIQEIDFIPLQGLQTSPHETYTVGAAAVTLSVPKHAQKIMMQALTQNVRYTLNGTTPTASKGFQLKASDAPIVIRLDPWITIKVIREAAGAVLEYEYGR